MDRRTYTSERPGALQPIPRPLHPARGSVKVLHAKIYIRTSVAHHRTRIRHGGRSVIAPTSAQPQARWGRLVIIAVACLAILEARSTLVAQLPASPLPNEKIPTVVLDPGRGGSNQGARGPTGLLEKDITLQVATEAGRLIEELLGLHVVLTRTDDSDIPLEARATAANQAGADLFISIHAGGSLGTTRREFQTFYFDDMQGSLPAEPAPAQERDVSGEGGQRRRGAGPRPQLVLWDQAQRDFLDTSQMFARILYNNLRAQVAEEGRGVFGLPILLLRWVRMPAVLLDLGSLNDPGFEAKLRDDAYLQRAALGIAQAVNDYHALQR
jgi:N-acetylmuramoyl-L-alanine amidase